MRLPAEAIEMSSAVEIVERMPIMTNSEMPRANVPRDNESKLFFIGKTEFFRGAKLEINRKTGKKKNVAEGEDE